MIFKGETGWITDHCEMEGSFGETWYGMYLELPSTQYNRFLALGLNYRISTMQQVCCLKRLGDVNIGRLDL